VSERRGGYARCAAWHVLSYTLYSMAPDGSDIRPLSYHETNEWHPAVTHEGMIIYTRWDYVDRGDCVAHHPWITTPDGCDPRALHGNYPPAEGSARPNMEMHIRPIPGSSRYVAVAAPHHGYSTGSLVRLDFARPDDDQVSQVRRITPMVPFPEVAYRPLPDAHFYAPGYDAAWPITEDLYLSSYKYEAQNEPFNRLGVCLVDTFGNRTLVYADEQFDCVTPQPIRARPVPPVLPRRTGADPQAAADGEGVVTCVDEAILDGQEPDGLPRRSGTKTGLSLRSLRRDLPLEWDEQRRSLAE
jgi:hypothetical protein